MLEYMNTRLLAAQPSGIRRFTKIARQTEDCLMLTIGEPDFSTPEPIKNACKQALDENLTHYPMNVGALDLREKVAAFEREKNGYDYSPDEIIMTHGATEAIFIALQGILNPGDEVIIPVPAFNLYESIVKLAGGVPVFVDTARQGFQLEKEQLLRAITPRTKAVILNSPNNPTGVVYTEQTMQGIYEVLKQRPIFVLCDDVYAQLSYTPCKSFATFRDLREKLLVIQSFSKPYAMTGWRMGYLMGDAPLMQRLALYHAYTVVSVSSISQKACMAALDWDITDMLQTYRHRRDYIYQRLQRLGLDVICPEGAFYIFPSIAKYGMDSETFCTRMVQEGKLAGVPGCCFGQDGFVRFSYCYSEEEIAEGMDRLERFLKTLEK